MLQFQTKTAIGESEKCFPPIFYIRSGLRSHGPFKSEKLGRDQILKMGHGNAHYGSLERAEAPSR